MDYNVQNAGNFTIAEAGAYQLQKPFVSDGLDQLGAACVSLCEQGQSFALSEAQMILAQGNLVFLMTA